MRLLWNIVDDSAVFFSTVLAMVKCCGFVEFRRELGKKTPKKWKFAKKI
jgi:hypothetical protein